MRRARTTPSIRRRSSFSILQFKLSEIITLEVQIHCLRRPARLTPSLRQPRANIFRISKPMRRHASLRNLLYAGVPRECPPTFIRGVIVNANVKPEVWRSPHHIALLACGYRCLRSSAAASRERLADRSDPYLLDTVKQVIYFHFQQ